MDKQSVKGIMECYRYNNSKLKVSNKELDIDDVFIKDDKEVYIILEDELWMDQIFKLFSSSKLINNFLQKCKSLSYFLI